VHKLFVVALLGFVSFSANAAGLFYNLHSIATYNVFAPTGTQICCSSFGGIVFVDSGNVSSVDSLQYGVASVPLPSSVPTAYNYTQGIWSAVVGGSSVTHTETCTEAAGPTKPCTSALSGLSGVWNSTQANGGAPSHSCAATAFFSAGLCDRVSIVELPGNTLTIIEQSEFAVPGLASGYIYVFFPAPVPPAVWLFGSALGVMGVMRRQVSR
jgi:hypothetical protein